MRGQRSGGLAILLLLPAATAFGGIFQPYVTLPVGDATQAVAIGDVNGDGRKDLVVTTGFYGLVPGKLYVFHQNANGSLGAPVLHPIGTDPVSVALGDLNGDGRLDVAIGNLPSEGTRSIQFLLQNALGGLNPLVEYPTPNSRTYAEATERFGEGAAERFRDSRRSRVHGGETLEDVADRVWRAWESLPQTKRGACVVVAHATPIQVLLCRILQMPLERYWQIRIDLGSISHVSVDTAAACLRSLNQVPRLPCGGRGATR